ncbi:MAG: site-specific recombinase, partial [Betaproteobacteria bacterium]
RLLALLVDVIRPKRLADSVHAAHTLNALLGIITARLDLRTGLARALGALFRERQTLSLLTAAGILPSTGFFTETARRISHTLLPEVIDPQQLRDLLRVLFPHADDADWVREVPDEVWIALLEVLYPAGEPPQAGQKQPFFMEQLLEAMRTLSYWVAAAGLEPGLVRLEPELSRYESPFAAQNVELLKLIGEPGAEERATDSEHLLVLLSQCHDWLDLIRRRSLRFGTSIALTFQIRRLRQMLKRMERLLATYSTLDAPAGKERDWRPVVVLFKRLVKAECLRNNLRAHWRQHFSLLALRVTENAGRAGEHYITESRAEYFALLRSAMGAGLIIALMALDKTLIVSLGLPPLTEGLAICLNYGLGFVLIHLLHFTVATKQPAMTANAIAASLDGSKGRNHDLDNLADLVARTVRSQIAAIFGNIALAIPTAIAISLFLKQLFGWIPIGADKAAHLLADVHPLTSPSLFYAAVAGVCLFLSGLIAGYFDNLAAFERIPERIAQLSWARRWFGHARMERVAAYIADNLGALAGNFFFGFLLGGATTFGILFGLLVDIRHVAFSSANLGYALAGSQFAPDWHAFAWAAGGVLLIAGVNLAVSFSLALYVALRSRSISLADSPRFVSTLVRHLMKNPREFFLPPKSSPSIKLETDLPVK